MIPLHFPTRDRRPGQPAHALMLLGALAMSLLASGSAAAQPLIGDDHNDVLLISPARTAPPLSGLQRIQLKLHTTAGYDILVNG